MYRRYRAKGCHAFISATYAPLLSRYQSIFDANVEKKLLWNLRDFSGIRNPFLEHK